MSQNNRPHITGEMKRLSPLIVAPVLVLLFKNEMPAWVFMWLFSFTIYISLKWLTFADGHSSQKPSVLTSLGYLLCWPGMDADSFFLLSENFTDPKIKDWIIASCKTLLGGLLFFISMPMFYPKHPYITGWVSMIGIVMMLHFGIFHLLSLFWKKEGHDVKPLMDSPLLSWSLGNFWGQRWNLAFRDLANKYVFKATVRKVGVKKASFLVFIVSGIVHDAVISIPSNGGWGLPTLYFLIQGFGVLFEKSSVGKKLNLGNGFAGRFFTFLVLILPLPLLFHTCFIENIIIPMQIAIIPFDF